MASPEYLPVDKPPAMEPDQVTLLMEPTRASDKFERQNNRSNRPPASDLDTASVSLRRLLSEALPEWRLMTAGTFCLLCSSGALLALPALFGEVMDGVISNEQASDDDRRARFKVLGVQILAVTVGTAVFGTGQAYAFNSAGASLVTRVRKRVFGTMCAQPISFFDLTRTGELTSRLSSDVTLLRTSLTGDMSRALKSTVVLIGGVCYLFTMSPKLTGVMLTTVPVVTLMATLFGRKLRQLQKDVQAAIAISTAEAEEAIANIRTVRLFSAEQRHVGLYDAAVDDSLALMKRAALWNGVFGSLMGLLFGLATLAIIGLGVNMVINHQISAGVLISFVLYTFTISGAVGSLTAIATNLMKAAGAAERIYAIIDQEHEKNVDSGAWLDDVTGDIVLEDLHFEYPSRPELPVINGLSMTMKAGTVTALVGPSGGGKSTVAGLVCRLYSPGSGRVTLDGVDLSAIDLRFLHKHIVSVSQEPILFSGTIAENILYGTTGEHHSHDSMLAAAQDANAHEFITSFPDGYNTLVGERGVQLSGGQKQRVAIARALVRQPQCLVLDEATSALDSESEQLVQEALGRCMQGRTVLVIAHRLSTVQDADCVVVVEAGRVTAQGTHAELIRDSDRYNSLVQKQLLRAHGCDKKSDEDDQGDELSPP